MTELDEFRKFKQNCNEASAAAARINRAMLMRNGNGEAYRHQVRRRVGKSMYHGELPLCVKSWLPCGARVTLIDLLAVGKDRRRALCAGFICELLDSPQKRVSKDSNASNNTKMGVKL